MFICTDNLSDERQEFTVDVDDDMDHPITLKLKMGQYAARIHLRRNEALEIMSKLEKAVHETAEGEVL
jgi:hypothetical protein